MALTTTTGDVSATIQQVGELYADNLREHGCNSKSVGWKDAESQTLRFDKLAEVILPAHRSGGFTCNDWGCGYGAMLDYLQQRSDLTLNRYYGYDISPEMIAAARSTPRNRAEFIEAPLPTQLADYTFVGGTFNVRFQSSDAVWADYVRQSLCDLWKKTRQGLAFNLLTTFVDWRAEDLFYADPAEFFTFCRRNLSRYVTLLHDYTLYEWTILVRREP
ncbi:MAG: class I SAM-dependent methyltransferase [Planctomycetaceae bacterium]